VRSSETIKKNLVIFDLDGVIVDTRRNMEQAWKDVCTEFHLSVPFEEYFANIGRPFADIISILGLGDQTVEIAEVYSLSSMEHQQLISTYPGMVDVLQLLVDASVKLGIVTSKDATRTARVLESVPVNFDVVQTPNGQLRGKPAPDHLLAAMAIANVDPSLSCYIGDMSTDCECALRAGIDYAHASWGYEAIPLEQPVMRLLESQDLLGFAGIASGSRG
jgi:HAD superfamily hydrolase (TIGR01549 family)